MVLVATQMIGHRCPSGHNLDYIQRGDMPRDYPRDTNVYCDNCAGTLRMSRAMKTANGELRDVSEPFTHCSKCRFDLCMDCFTADDERYAALYHTRMDGVIAMPGHSTMQTHASGITLPSEHDGIHMLEDWSREMRSDDHWSRCNMGEDRARDMDGDRTRAYSSHGPECMARK